MTEAEQRQAAKQFSADWKDRGDEKQDSQRFWLSLLQNICGVSQPTNVIEFEKRVMVDNFDGTSTQKYIDGYLPTTRVLIEQKGAKIDLKKGELQSDGAMLTPFQQGRRYGGALPDTERPRWIVVCNFQEFHIHDMNRPNEEPETVLLENLEKERHRLGFLVDTGNENVKKEMVISLQAGELVGVLYDALLKQYQTPDDPETLKSLNKLCVRLVFCLYAEDAGIFGRRNMFHDYLENHRSEDRRALINLFCVLDQKPEQRDKYLDDDLAAFPYVNGGLFADEEIEIPRLGDEIIDLLLSRASGDFDWSAISPTIFGAVFESTLNPETRRSGGMHYTSIENIHKVIDPLFLDDLNAELKAVKAELIEKNCKARARALQQRCASLRFLDPACGSGNFLTETYLSLRRIENELLSILHHGQVILDMDQPIRVSIDQFYGIEINDFAVTVAKTALWIAESQMMKETEDVVHMSLDFLPLKTNAHIVEGNALRMDWNEVVPKEKLHYIMGNPPFVGASMMTAEQKGDAVAVFGKIKLSNSIDYVGAWYHKAAAFMSETTIRTAFVSTNSITQGEQVAPLWEKLFIDYKIHIDFAYRTFRWDSEASLKAHVHCVIVGFSSSLEQETKLIYTDNGTQTAININAYLIDGPDVFISSRSKPLCDVTEMVYGNKPTDDGNLILTQEERDTVLRLEPELEKYIHPYIGSVEFINKKLRYCFWLKDVQPTEIKSSKELYQRVEAVRKFRLNSTAAPTRAKADIPHLFFFISQPKKHYLMVPRVSSQNRKYIPIGFMEPYVIASDSCSIIPNAQPYHFGVLTSNVHMAWMRTVAGRLKSDYRYSGSVVYNNFPWPTPTDEQKAKIEETAQAILDARSLYPDSSLAGLYDETTMPPELRKAHQQNDKAVMAAYGFSVKDMTESSCVAELMKRYQELTKKGRNRHDQ